MNLIEMFINHINHIYYMANKIIVKVRENKTTKQKQVTIPWDSNIKKGEYVEIKKLESYDGSS